MTRRFANRLTPAPRLCALVVVATLAAGCGGDANGSIDSDGVAKTIETGIEEQLDLPMKVACPSDIDRRTGAKFTCTATSSDKDEFDVEEPLVEPAGRGGIRVHARMAVDEVNALLQGELPEDGDWDSVGGLVYHLLGHVPAEGEAVEIEGYRLAAEKVQGRRIGRVRITPLPPDDHRRDDEGGPWIKAENVPTR